MSLKDAFDVRHPVFKPIWRRVAVVVVTYGWAGFEAFHGNTWWAVLFAAAGTWCAHQFFVAWDRPGRDDKTE
ncbi:hypothetical protein [Thetidibacter halocola]|uniref:DUF3329 domain-containing protein n=1 Tax=Thetidibacter halocola TaxID=2827239 RepID=A0A8J7WHY5_9RHOB|nr:hypothetical protein [Thetidibacter halocola]MBS0125443.1 hypothetical protein [Thetidibacter halocola]